MMMFRQNTVSPDDLFEGIRTDVFEAMQEFGGEVVEYIRDLISVDVQFTGVHRGKNYKVYPLRGQIRPSGEKLSVPEEHIIRSSRGEPPRRETSTLWHSIESDVETDADVVTLEVFSECPYAGYLEDQLDRPYFSTAENDLAEEFFDRVAAAFAGR